MVKKYRRIPKDLKTRPEDLVMDVREINTRVGDIIYMVMGEVGHDIKSIGADCVKDIAFYANYFEVFGKDLPEDISVLKVRVEDPENLPYEISDFEFVYVIYDDWDLEIYGSMEEAADHIENSFMIHTEAEIYMFSVLVGREMPEGIKNKFIEKYKEIGEGRRWSKSVST